MAGLRASLILLATSSLVSAQYGYGGNGGGDYNGYGNPYNSNGVYNPNTQFGNLAQLLNRQQKVVIAHGVLAAAAFVFLFPVGAIIIRLGNFQGSWLVHAAVQALAYLLYIAAFGIGIYMTSHVGLTNEAHPIIGIILFILLFFQPFLGLIHHIMFRKHSKRVVWSYGHIWLGRIAITLGIINGGLGLQLAQRTRVFAPSRNAIIAYSVVAAFMWLLYVVCAVIGEVKRSRAQKIVPPHKQMRETSPVGPVDAGGHQPDHKPGQIYA